MNNVYLAENMEYVYTHLENRNGKTKSEQNEIVTYIIFGDAKG